MEFGGLLTKYRREASLTLREFARRVNYDPSNISKIERGVLAPPASNVILRKWASALGLQEGARDYNNFLSSGVSGTFVRKYKTDTEIEELMPAFCRTVANKKVDPSAYKELMHVLKQNM